MMPTGPTEEVGFVCSSACFITLGWTVKGGGGHLVGAACVGLWLYSCQWSCVVVWRWMHSVYRVGSTVLWGRGLCSYLWLLVLYDIVLRSCFHVVCCLCRISSCIYSFNVCMRLMISGVGRWCLKWFLVRILCLMFLLKPGPNRLIELVGIYCLLLCVIVVLKLLWLHLC